MVQNQLVEDNLRQMLRDLFKIDSRGGRRDKLARAHGYTDGYMMALVDIGIATQDQLLRLVQDERRRVCRAPGEPLFGDGNMGHEHN